MVPSGQYMFAPMIRRVARIQARVAAKRNCYWSSRNLSPVHC
ncbi:hypothetical protein D7S44_22250 [Pantoea piersonii]|nr:hypothetical protein D7S44_22250 [Pantoea piersonii]